MKNLIEDTYQELLNNFNNDKTLEKIIRYFENKPILNIFTKDFLIKYNKPKQKKNEIRNLLKTAHFPLISQHLLPDQPQSGIQDSIKWIKEEYQIKDSMINNYEALTIQNFNLTEEEKKKFFSFDATYNLMALVYAAPFADLPNYEEFKKLYYYLIMYINLELSFNKFIVLDRFEPFLVKLAVQTEMIKTLAIVDSKNYNELIRKLNRWFTRKALYKVMRELDKMNRGKR